MTTGSLLASSDISFMIVHCHRQRGKTTPILKMAGNILEIRTGFPARRESARGSLGCLSKDNSGWAPSVSVDYFLLWAKKNMKERNRKVMSIAQVFSNTSWKTTCHFFILSYIFNKKTLCLRASICLAQHTFASLMSELRLIHIYRFSNFMKVLSVKNFNSW
jgi:hypothetical protein